MNYNEMLRLVVGRTGLTRRQAESAVAAAMTVLAGSRSPPRKRKTCRPAPQGPPRSRAGERRDDRHATNRVRRAGRRAHRFGHE